MTEHNKLFSPKETKQRKHAECGRKVYYQIHQDIQNGRIIRVYDRNSSRMIRLGKHVIWNGQPAQDSADVKS